MAISILEREIKLSKQDGERLVASKPTAKYHEVLVRGKAQKNEYTLKPGGIKLPWFNMDRRK